VIESVFVKMKRAKAPVAPKIKYDIFMECAKTESIQFWKTILEQCAYGQFPKGMSFRDGAIVYKKSKTKQPITKFLPENIEDAKKTVIDFLRTDIGYNSRDEILLQQLEASLKMKEILRKHDTVWKDIRAGSTKRQMICIYVQMKKEKMKLTNHQATQLYDCIINGLALGTLIGDDIEMDRGTILDIDNIDRLSNGFFTTRRIIREKIYHGYDKHKNEQITVNEACAKFYQKFV